MQWTDEGIVLSAYPLGDQGLRTIVMTRMHGRHAGLARGRRVRPACQAGTMVQATWRARLSDHLGTWTLEVVDAIAQSYLDDRNRLSALTSALALVEMLTGEREPSPEIHDDLKALVGFLAGPAWDVAYLRWELAFLGHIGYRLDLSRCAVTGRTDNLVHVSPRTGRAVSATAGAPYADRLLRLPSVLLEGWVAASPSSVLEGLSLTGYFLERALNQTGAKAVPARERFVARYARIVAASVEEASLACRNSEQADRTDL